MLAFAADGNDMLAFYKMSVILLQLFIVFDRLPKQLRRTSFKSINYITHSYLLNHIFQVHIFHINLLESKFKKYTFSGINWEQRTQLLHIDAAATIFISNNKSFVGWLA